MRRAGRRIKHGHPRYWRARDARLRWLEELRLAGVFAGCGPAVDLSKILTVTYLP